MVSLLNSIRVVLLMGASLGCLACSDPGPSGSNLPLATWPEGAPAPDVLWCLYIQDGPELVEHLAHLTQDLNLEDWFGKHGHELAGAVMLDPHKHEAPMVLSLARPDRSAGLRWLGEHHGLSRRRGDRAVLVSRGFSPYGVLTRGARAIPLPGTEPFVYLRLADDRLAGSVDEVSLDLASPWLLAKPHDMPLGPVAALLTCPDRLCRLLKESGQDCLGFWRSSLSELLTLLPGGSLNPEERKRVLDRLPLTLTQLGRLRISLAPNGSDLHLNIRLWFRDGSPMADGLFRGTFPPPELCQGLGLQGLFSREQCLDLSPRKSDGFFELRIKLNRDSSGRHSP